MSATSQPADSFFAFVRRRRLVMAVVGFVLLVFGAIGAAVVGGGAVVWLGAVALVGALLLGSLVASRGPLREAHVLAAGVPTPMELTTWPYRTSGRALINNRVLVTLDRLGSVDRTPLAEFKAVWFTPGAGESPARPARVYGSLARGQTVLAIAEDGSCFVGRISRTRQAR